MRHLRPILAASLGVVFCALQPLSAHALLQFVDCYKDSAIIDGLYAATFVKVSADGKHVYVAGFRDDAVAVFTRNPNTGKLTYVEMQRDGVGGVDGLSGAHFVAFSPDEKHVYVAGSSDSAVAVFSRDSSTGALSYVETQRDGIAGVDGLWGARSAVVSPDGKHVYVAGLEDDAVAVFGRDPNTGALTYIEIQQNGVGGVSGLNGAETVTISPDGKHVYVASRYDDTVVLFSRDPATGALTWVETKNDGIGGVDGLNGAYFVAVSPDGMHVYVAGSFDDAVAVFRRDPSTGTLTYVEMKKDGVGGVDGLDYPLAVTVSPDGKHVYVTGLLDDAVAVFRRDPSTGTLTYVEMKKDGVGGVDGLWGASSVTVSPDGKHVYATGSDDNAVAVFVLKTPYVSPSADLLLLAD